MSETVKLKITTLTPVTIGSGTELSPYSDYIIDNNKVCFIDKKKMQDKILQKGDQYLDLYIQGVATGIDNNRSEFNLKSFLTNNKIVSNISEVIAYQCPFVGIAGSKLPVKGLLKSPLQQPYFPGSSIKGAFKTVLMHNWLTTNKNGDETIEKVINGGSFDFLEKQIEYKEDELTHKVIRKNIIQQVTDSSLMAKENIVVVDCYRKMPIRFECIAKGNSAEFELTLENYKWHDFAKQANKYAEDSISREFSLIEKNDDLTKYYNHLVEIEDMVIDGNGTIAYFRLGFGKGYYSNSLGIAIYNYVKKEGKNVLYNKFTEFINRQFAKKDKFRNLQEIDLEEFPKTRLFVTKTQEPLGWIRIEKMSN